MNQPLLNSLNFLIKSCDLCSLRKGCRGPVTACSPIEEDSLGVMFIGQNPSYKGGDITGENFTGKSGKRFFNEMEKRGYLKKAFYITNIVKCAGELEGPILNQALKSCISYLLSEIAIVKPRMIVTLGNIAKDIVSDIFDVDSSKKFTLKDDLHFAFLQHPSYYFCYGNEAQGLSDIDQLVKTIRWELK